MGYASLLTAWHGDGSMLKMRHAGLVAIVGAVIAVSPPILHKWNKTMKRQTFSQNLNSLDGDDTPVTIEYVISDRGARASHDDPGWAMEIEIVNAYHTMTGEVAALSDEETEYFRDWIIDNHVDDGPDPDDARETRRERF